MVAAILEAFNPLSLDAVNFLLSDVRRALGPYLKVFLITRQHFCGRHLLVATTIGPGKPLGSRGVQVADTVGRALANLPPFRTFRCAVGHPPGRGTGQQPQPGLVVVIQNRDGSQVDVMIEHDPLAGQMGDLEPQKPRN